jgi:RNA polymerase sigma-70 factor (ECF subfamily)
VAQPGDAGARRPAPRVALPDRDERVPRRDPAADPLRGAAGRRLGDSATGGEPDDLVARRETLELAFLAALEQLTPRQRAAFFLRDVLDWSARDTAAVLGVSVPAANSALQRARERLRDALPLQRREDWRGPSRPTRRGRALLDRLVAV